jgi:hypothetical protein
MALSRFVLPFADVGAGITPSSGAKLYFYATGTTTPSTTYADSTGDTPNANPVIAYANGIFPAIFLSGIFNVVLKDANDVQIWTADPVSLFSSFLVENEETDPTCFPLFVTAATGTLDPKTNATFTFDSDTGNLVSPTVDGRDVSVDGAKLDTIGAIPVKITLVTASDATWAFTAGARAIEFTPVGGAGGGGGIDGQGASTGAASEAGAGGAHCIKLVTSPSGTFNITIGAGGAGGATGTNDGSTGGDTTIVGTGISVNAKGGLGGTGFSGAAGSQSGSNALGQTATGGDINGKGVGSTTRSVSGGNVSATSTSGFCPFIGGGITRASGADGTDGSVYGEGGGSSFENGSNANHAGGDGFQGAVFIKEFF